MIKHTCLAVAVTALTLLSVSAARAETGTEVLALLDAAMTRAQDQSFSYRFITTEKGRDPLVMENIVKLKGEMRWTEIVKPADMAGTKVLVRSRSQMWIYLPAYSKVRRVASHSTTGNFLGTTLSNEDISASTYGSVYEGKLLSETEEAWVVEATVKEGQKAAYSKIEFTISKAYHQPLQIKYFNKKGAHIKTETRSGYSCQQEVCNAERMVMVDHTRNDAATEMLRGTWEVNTGLDDSVFSLNNLD
jgi:outer membrane lipoprotein-sorting protein